MNKYKYYLFDLDGTISESALGIRESLENAIKSMGKPLPNLDDYTLYIGPPLLDTFRNICHFNEEESARGVEIYREYYNTKGKLVNKLYDGIDRVLAELKNSGARVAVCSSKYEKFAEEITELLGVHDMFDAICGSTLDGSRKDKKDLIPYAVERLGGSLENDRKDTVMIGDTWFDTRVQDFAVLILSVLNTATATLKHEKRGRQGVCKNNGRTLGCSYKVNNLKSDKRNYPKIFRIHFIRE